MVITVIARVFLNELGVLLYLVILNISGKGFETAI